MIKYNLQKIVYDPVGNGEYNCYIAKEIELTEEELYYLGQCVWLPIELQEKFRKVLKNE